MLLLQLQGQLIALNNIIHIPVISSVRNNKCIKHIKYAPHRIFHFPFSLLLVHLFWIAPQHIFNKSNDNFNLKNIITF